MTLRDSLRAYLQADSTLMGLLSGGLLDANSLPRDGGGMSSVPLAGDGLTILPFAILRWGVTTPKEIVRNSERRNLAIFIYQESGYGQIEAVQARLKMRLHRQRLSASDAGIAMCHWLNDTGEFPAPEFGNCAGSISRYVVDYIRK